MHFAFGPFDSAYVFTEATLVTNLWHSGITILIRKSTITRLVVGAQVDGSVDVGALLSLLHEAEATQEQQEDWLLLLQQSFLLSFWVGLHCNGLGRNS